jgi:hypothetical protein
MWLSLFGFCVLLLTKNLIITKGSFRYVRFTNPKKNEIDWMLVTSANLSKQAWGEAPNAADEIRICSYEIGVMVWPELFRDTKANTGR